jgi:diguanylate cyclase (GGDEF)-like protein/PAS domain S-box-containing protein
MSIQDEPFAPEPKLPQSAEFYRRVLREWPSPVLVVDASGTIVYANRALAQIGGWDLQENVGSNVLDYLHPDDTSQLAEAFFQLAEVSGTETFDVQWGSINTRMIAKNGQEIPVVVTGSAGLGDPAVNGIVYDIRPAHEQDILRRGLTGLAQGEPIEDIFKLITDMVALPPLGLDSAVLEPRGDGTYRVIGATDPTLEKILEEAVDPQPWNHDARQPTRTFVAQFPGDVGEDLFAAGYREFWHVSPETTNAPDSYRLIACGRVIQTPANGPVDRMARANELASVVLLRARADALLEHSATHDRLTQLPNREGFHRKAIEAMDSWTSDTAAMLFIDLDGFKEVNDAHGHAAGDLVLAVVAQRLSAVTRSVDLVARLGGDEFVILVGASADRPANLGRVQVIADRALQQLRRPIDIGETNVQIAASIGAVVAPMPITLEDLLLHADGAMYEAKRNEGDQHYLVELH